MVYDIAIVGGGPAGLTAGIYAARSGRSVILFEGDRVGGKLWEVDEIENYPGVKKTSGERLANIMYRQAKGFGVRFVHSFVSAVAEGKPQQIFTMTEDYNAKAVVLAMGITRTKLGFEEQYIGKGVSYCATCDGNFYKGKEVAVVGNGYTAIEDALYLSKICSKVYLVHSKPLAAEKPDLLKIQSASNMIDIPDSSLTGLQGESKLAAAEIMHLPSRQKSLIAVEGVFVALGSQPVSDIVSGLTYNNQKFIVTNDKVQTGIDGIYAAGDIVFGSQKQVVSACADGALCVDKIIKAER